MPNILLKSGYSLITVHGYQVTDLRCMFFPRSLEYTIHDHELRDTRKKLEDLQEKRENSGQQSHKLRDLQQQAADQIKVR